MAVQQSKKSKSRKGMRRSHHHVALPATVLCECGATTMSHSVCQACGTYRKRNYTEEKQ